MLYVNPVGNADAVRAAARAVSVDGSSDAAAARQTLALQELEHLFAFMLLQELRKGAPEGGFLDGGSTEQIYEEMLDDALSAEMARSGQLGVAQQMADQLRAVEKALSVSDVAALMDVSE